jgi:hypothetical protein
MQRNQDSAYLTAKPIDYVVNLKCDISLISGMPEPLPRR